MDDMITREELLGLISVVEGLDGAWCIEDVLTDVYGKVQGNIYGDIDGCVLGDVLGGVRGNVFDLVGGTINGKHWQYVETPVEKLKRLVAEDADREQIIEAINQLEDN